MVTYKLHGTAFAGYAIPEGFIWRVKNVIAELVGTSTAFTSLQVNAGRATTGFYIVAGATTDTNTTVYLAADFMQVTGSAYTTLTGKGPVLGYFDVLSISGTNNGSISWTIEVEESVA